MHDGRVRRAYLGLVSTPARLTPVQAERFGQRGALRVIDVVENSPAAHSGLRAGDLVLAVDGGPLGDAQSLQKRLFAEAIGQRMEITVLRNGALVDAVALPTELTDWHSAPGVERLRQELADSAGRAAPRTSEGTEVGSASATASTWGTGWIQLRHSRRAG